MWSNAAEVEGYVSSSIYNRADIWSEKEIIFIRNEAKVTNRVGCVK